MGLYVTMASEVIQAALAVCLCAVVTSAFLKSNSQPLTFLLKVLLWFPGLLVQRLNLECIQGYGHLSPWLPLLFTSLCVHIPEETIT